MNKFYTADLHCGHGAVIEYSKRPFKSAEHMIDQYIKRFNQMVKPEDIVYHLGDFCCYGKNRGIEGMRVHAKDILSQLNGTWIMIEGNHDHNNKVKTHAKFMFITIANRPTILSHYPSFEFYDDKTWHHKFIDKKDIQIWLCGHVHEKWKYVYDTKNAILNINMGIDVWNHNLVKETKLISYIEQLTKDLKDPMFPKEGLK